MSVKSGIYSSDGIRLSSTEQDHRPVILSHSFSASPLAVHSFPPEIKKAAFYSRSSSHSSITSSHQGITNEGDYQQSRPGTPISILASESSVSYLQIRASELNFKLNSKLNKFSCFRVNQELLIHGPVSNNGILVSYSTYTSMLQLLDLMFHLLTNLPIHHRQIITPTR